MPGKRFWKDRLLSIVDEIAAALIIAGGGALLYSGWLIFRARVTGMSVFQEILAVVLPLLLLILFGIYVWERRGRFAVDVKGRILDDRLREKGKYFVGREELVAKFRKAINPKEKTDRLFALFGVGGIGKSALLEEFRRICYEENVPFAYCEGSIIHNEIDVFQTIHEQLAAYNVPFGSFQKGMDRYYRLQAKVGEHPDISPKVIQMLSKGLVAATDGVPVAKGVAEAVGAENIEVAMSAIYRLLKPEEAKFFLHPEQELTDMLVNDLNDYLANGPLAIFFDTYEQMESLDEWLRLRFVERLSKQAVVVFAGRNPLHRDWGYTAIIRQELRELPTDASVNYLRSKGIDNDKLIGDIVAFTGGLPLALTLINEMLRAHPDLTFDDLPKEKEMLPALVEQMLRTAPDDMRDVLEVCAALRWFNVDILAYMLDVDEAEAREIFQRLQKLEFVIQKGKKGLALHDRLREFLDQTAKFVDEKGYKARHEKAMGYFDLRLKTKAYLSEDYVTNCAEKVCHLSKVKRFKAQTKFISKWYEFYMFRSEEFLNRFLELIVSDIGFDQEEISFWRKFNTATVHRVNGYYNSALSILEELKKFEMNNLMRASLYGNSAGLYRIFRDYEKGLSDIEISLNSFEAIEMVIEANLAKGMKANIYLDLGRFEKAQKLYFEIRDSFVKLGANIHNISISICIGNSFRMLGHPDYAIVHYDEAISDSIKFGMVDSEFEASVNKGEVLIDQQEFQVAKEMLSNAESKARKLRKHNWLGYCQCILGRVLLSQNKAGFAFESYLSSFTELLKFNCLWLYQNVERSITHCKQTNHPEILQQLLAYWQDPANTLDGLTLIEAEQRNRERENATGPTVVEQLQAAIAEMRAQNDESGVDE